MFTGIVEEIGTVLHVSSEPGGGARLHIRGPLAAQGAHHGDSIAVSGVCLTVVDQPAPGEFVVDVMPETLRRTSLGTLRDGARVNLERSLRADARLHGHIVQGHVDGVGRLLRRRDDGGWVELEISVPGPLTRLVAEKGAVALNGVSLTITGVDHPAPAPAPASAPDLAPGEGSLGVALIPETLRATNLGLLEPGDPVNIEVDVIARYVARLLEVGGAEN